MLVLDHRREELNAINKDSETQVVGIYVHVQLDEYIPCLECLKRPTANHVVAVAVLEQRVTVIIKDGGNKERRTTKKTAFFYTLQTLMTVKIKWYIIIYKVLSYGLIIVFQYLAIL